MTVATQAITASKWRWRSRHCVLEDDYYDDWRTELA
jgi:hypothetical protein